jgi:hypothetical protein
MEGPDLRNRINPSPLARPLLPSIHWALWLALGLASLSSTQAQIDPSRLNESTGSVSRAPRLYSSEELNRLGLEDENAFAPESDGDEDLGEQLILKEIPKDRPFRSWAEGSLFWTDNAANVSAGQVEDLFWGGRVGFGWQPRLTKNWFADFEVSQGLYRYDKSSALDFETLRAMASILDVEPRLGGIVLFAGVGYERVTNDMLSNDLLNSLSIRAGAQKTFLIDRKNSINVSLMGDWDVYNDFGPLFRHELNVDLSYQYKVTRALSFRLAYRLSYLHYQRVDRDDTLHLFGASLVYNPTNWLEVYANGNYAINNSKIPFFDYETGTVGGGLGMRIKY